MNTLRKSLQAVAAVLALAPTAVFAYPPQCDESCSLSHYPCEDICYIGTQVRTTCGEAGYCWHFPLTSSEPTTSVKKGEVRQEEEAAPVCNDTQPAEARPATAEN